MATTKQILEHLTVPIPLPRRPAPKPQDSWATLKVGDRLVQKQAHGASISEGKTESSTFFDEKDGEWVVTKVSSAGASLERGGEVVELSDRDWRRSWQKAKRRKKGDKNG